LKGSLMDTVTHTLFGLTLYGAVDKSQMTVKEKRALLLTTLVGSQIPDIDIVSSWWDTAGRYQMWHRGITHSLFLVPVWAVLIVFLIKILFKVKGRIWFGMALLAVFIHDTSDIFNAWGTGYFEPVSTMRLTFGTIPIVDLVFWGLMLGGLLLARFGRGRLKLPSHQIFKGVWVLIALHILIQTTQGGLMYNMYKDQYEQVALSADFIPGVFTVIGKQAGTVELNRGTLWTGVETIAVLKSQDDANLDTLFTENPKAKTLVEWSPFVVVVDDGETLGVYDPRFYRNGQSFLFESIDK
jgi:inner membrane protein